MRLLLRWLINTLVIMAIAYWLPGVAVSGLYAAFITALILGLVNAIIRPILFILTLPINILTLGLFTFVLNALLFWFVASIVDGFAVSGFIPALLGSLILSVVSAVLGWTVARD